MSAQPLLAVLDVIRDHLVTHALPEAASVYIGFRGVISVQLHPNLSTEAETAAALLAWADTLTDCKASMWQPPADSLWQPQAELATTHYKVVGWCPGGKQVEVYRSVRNTPGAPGADLGPGEQRTVTLAELRVIAGGGGR